MIKAVVSDCDGTVYDNRGSGEAGDLAGLRKAYKELGINAKLPSRAELIARMGFPHPEFFRGIIPDEEFERAYPVVYDYTIQEIVRRVCLGKGRLFPGVIRALSRLKHNSIRLGLVTSGPKDYLDAVVRTYKLRDFFDVCMSIQEIRGDKSDLVAAVLKKLDCKRGEAVVVGDRGSDVEAGRKSGCLVAAAMYGYGNRSELAGADFRLRSFAGILQIVLKS